MMAAEKRDVTNSIGGWSAANYAYLEAELERLRLLLHRRVLWLRTLWKRDPAVSLESLGSLIISDESADDLLNGESPEAEIRFFERDEAARHITDLLTRQNVRIEEAAASVRAAGMPAPPE